MNAGSGPPLYSDGTPSGNLRTKNELDAILAETASSPGGSLLKTDSKRSSLTRRRPKKSPKSGEIHAHSRRDCPRSNSSVMLGTVKTTGAEELLGVLNQSGLAFGRNSEPTYLSPGNDLEASMDLLTSQTTKPLREGVMQQAPMRGQSPSSKNRGADPEQWQRTDQVLNQLLEQASPAAGEDTGPQRNGTNSGWPARLTAPNQAVEAVKMAPQPDETSQLDMESMESLLEVIAAES